MSHVRTEVRTYKVRWVHDDCGGEFFPTGIMYACAPPNYPHKCDLCGHVDHNSEMTFPRLVHEEVKP